MVSTWAGNCCACQDNTSLQKRRSTSIEMLLYGIRQRPIFPGRQCCPHHSQNDECSRHAHLRSVTAKKEAPRLRCFYMESGSDLSSRAVSSQVLSALKGLTAVFGMGTGGTPSSLPPEMVSCSLHRVAPASRLSHCSTFSRTCQALAFAQSCFPLQMLLCFPAP